MFLGKNELVRASRLLSMVLVLHARGRVSAAELAQEFGVSLRTVYRDAEALSAAGVPIYATRGRTGGFALVEGYRTSLSGLTPAEADAIFLAGLPGPAADLGLGGTLAGTQLKLLAALPPRLRERATVIRDRFHLDAPGWLRDTDTPPHLDVVAEAVWRQRRLEVSYERANRQVGDRVWEPLGLVLKAGSWYVVADNVADDRGPRTYRVSRVHGARITDAEFARPEGFDLAAFWDAYQRGYEARMYPARAQVRISPAGRDLLFLLGPIPAREARAHLGPADADGWCLTTIPIESIRHGQHALLQLGAQVEVLGPPELRAAISDEAAALRGRYG
jgi:predicted DNA-binding transcriptional regulator YafY